MKHSWAALIAIGLVAGTGFNQSVMSSAKPIASTSLLRCVAVDGDTLRCGNMRVRLSGVDAAELPGHCRKGRECAPGDPLKHMAALERFVRAPVLVTPLKIDRYGRYVSLVESRDGKNASCAAIAAGARYVLRWDEGLYVARACLSTVRVQSINVKGN